MYFKPLLLGLVLVNIIAFFVTPVRADNPYDAKARELESEGNRLTDASESTCDSLLAKADNALKIYKARSQVYGNDKIALRYYNNGIYYIRFAKRQGCDWAKNIKVKS